MCMDCWKSLHRQWRAFVVRFWMLLAPDWFGARWIYLRVRRWICFGSGGLDLVSPVYMLLQREFNPSLSHGWEVHIISASQDLHQKAGGISQSRALSPGIWYGMWASSLLGHTTAPQWNTWIWIPWFVFFFFFFPLMVMNTFTILQDCVSPFPSFFLNLLLQAYFSSWILSSDFQLSLDHFREQLIQFSACCIFSIG